MLLASEAGKFIQDRPRQGERDPLAAPLLPINDGKNPRHSWPCCSPISDQRTIGKSGGRGKPPVQRSQEAFSSSCMWEIHTIVIIRKSHEKAKKPNRNGTEAHETEIYFPGIHPPSPTARDIHLLLKDTVLYCTELCCVMVSKVSGVHRCLHPWCCRPDSVPANFNDVPEQLGSIQLAEGHPT